MANSNNTDKSETSKPSLGWFTKIVLTLVLATFINKAAIYWLDFSWSMPLNFINYFLVYFLVLWFFKPNSKDKESSQTIDNQHPAHQWPLPAPIANLGKFAAICSYYPSLILSLLNPFLFSQQIRQMIGQGKIAQRLEKDPDYYTNYHSKIKYRLPFDNEWLVYHGGHTPETSHSWDLLTQRYAYDFVMADSHFARHNAKGNRLKDYYCYGQAIIAAADGRVVKVADGLSDGFAVGYFVSNFLTRDIAGNHIIIKHAEGEYGFYAHLLPHSIKPKVGDYVKKGQLLGLCGFSGNSTEPHLHFHLQDDESFYLGMGLPIKFHDLHIDGKSNDGECIIERGTRVQHNQFN